MMKNKNLLILSIILFFTACSQKTPKIDGQNNKFKNTFYPAKIDTKYIKGDIFTQKYPIIFMLGGYEGGWREDQHIRKLQRLGYHVVSIAYYDDAGYSNNLAKVNIDDIKKIIDSYKNYNHINTNAIGLIGRGKGAELALLMASYYPNIQMVVGISAPHVAFQASRATLATESSWTYKGKEVPFVAYPKLSFSAIKSLYRVIVQNDDYRDLHDLALEDKKALEKAQIHVEDINGSIFLASVTEDKMWNSPLMGEKIMQKLKKHKFIHQYEHKTYRGTWFLRGKDSEKAWGDIYEFVIKNLQSSYSRNLFLDLDKNQDKEISLDEYITQLKVTENSRRKKTLLNMFNMCDSNHNHKIDYFEARIPFNTPNNSDIVNIDDVYLPSINYSCRVSRSSFKEYDFNADMTINLNEFIQYTRSIKIPQHYIQPVNQINMAASARFKQCDKNNDKKINQQEAKSETCQINKSIFIMADKNKVDTISLNELIALPTKHARYRQRFHPSHKRDQVVYLNMYHSEKPTNLLLLSAIDECDHDHDGKLNKSEATSKSCGFTKVEFLEADVSKDGLFNYEDIELKDKIERFTKIDTNNNGKLNFFEWLRDY